MAKNNIGSFFGGMMKKQKTEEELAWHFKDWDKLSKIIKENSKDDPKPNYFYRVLDNLNYSKADINIEEEYPEYSPYLVNKILSEHVELIPHIALLNTYDLEMLSPQMHYNYLLLAIPKKKRYSSKNKAERELETRYVIQCIKKQWTVQDDVAEAYMGLMKHKGDLEEFIYETISNTQDEDFMMTVIKNRKEAKALGAQIAKKYTREEHRK